MSSVNDAKYASLLGYFSRDAGNIDDLENEWLDLVVLTITGTSVNDKWLKLFQENGATSDNINDAAYQFLVTLGYTGNISDMWYRFWTEDGISQVGIKTIIDRFVFTLTDRIPNYITRRV